MSGKIQHDQPSPPLLDLFIHLHGCLDSIKDSHNRNERPQFETRKW